MTWFVETLRVAPLSEVIALAVIGPVPLPTKTAFAVSAVCPVPPCPTLIGADTLGKLRQVALTSSHNTRTSAAEAYSGVTDNEPATGVLIGDPYFPA
jgi:hypothetical protein